MGDGTNPKSSGSPASGELQARCFPLLAPVRFFSAGGFAHNSSVCLVFKGPVHWTRNLTETGLDLTEKDRILVSVKSSPGPVQLMVQGSQEFQKDRKKPV